jgi:hypothetical protein
MRPKISLNMSFNTRSVLGVDTVHHHPNLLYIWLAGSGARAMETLDDEQIMEDSIKLIEKFLGADYPEMTRPIEILASPIHVQSKIELYHIHMNNSN